ncbi:MAG: ExbD/TolR family protein [Candidatus Eiseniibacteriota bacterium]
MRRSAAAPELITRINVTPIIDVALVLVIILLVTAPLMSIPGLPVNLPQARTRQAENQRNVSITLGQGGELAVDDRVVTPAEIREAIRSRLTEVGDDVLVVVRADSNAPYADVRALLDEARGAGAQRIAIATRQRVDVTP